MMDPYFISERLLKYGCMAGFGGKRDKLADRLAGEGMTESDLEAIIAWVNSLSYLDNRPAFLTGKLSDSVPESWRRILSDLETIKKAEAEEKSAPGASPGECMHGRAATEFCETCSGVPGTSPNRPGCWNPQTQSYNEGVADSADASYIDDQLASLRDRNNKLGITKGLIGAQELLGEQSDEMRRRRAWVRLQLGRARDGDAELLSGWEPPVCPVSGDVDIGVVQSEVAGSLR